MSVSTFFNSKCVLSVIWRADGSTGEVESVEVAAVQQRMYNLTVDVAHTFFVGDGQWLVHNCNSAGIAKHAEDRLDDFAEFGVNDLDDLADFVDEIVGFSDLSNTSLKNGRKAYWRFEDGDDFYGTLVIIDPKSADGGTIFRPDEGVKYFFENLK